MDDGDGRRGRAARGIGRRGRLGRRRRPRADPRGAGPAAAASSPTPAPATSQLQAVRAALPVPARATELLDLTGRWCRERTPQRRPWLLGTHLREGRHGRTGHDASPAAWPPARPGSASGTARCGPCTSRGAATTRRTPSGRRRASACSAAASCSGRARWCWRRGRRYASPVAGRRLLRRRARRRQRPAARLAAPALPAHPAAPARCWSTRWEAAYFDHDLDRLGELARAAAEVGVERFVLDDGWFRGRRTTGPGWATGRSTRTVWPRGAAPAGRRGQAARHGLRALGRAGDGQRGLRPGARPPRLGAARPRRRCRRSGGTSRCSTSRCPRPTPTCATRCCALLEEYDIAFLKWDHNRDLVDVAHGGRPAVHGQTLAFYRLLDELRAAHPRPGDRDLRQRRRPDRPRRC